MNPGRMGRPRAIAVAIVAAAIVCGIAAAARAEAPGSSPASMTLAEALSFASAHQPLIRSALARLDARHGEAQIPRAAWLPRLGATAQLFYGTANNSTASYVNVAGVDLPRIGGTPSTGAGGSLRPQPSTLAAATLDQEVYDFGRIAARIAVADALADEALADVDAARLDVQLAVEESFDAVLSAKEVLGAAEDAWKRASAHRDLAQAGVRSGLRPPIDLTRAQAELSQAEVRRVRARSGLVMARSALAAAIGADALEVDAVPLPTGVAPQPSPGLDEALRHARSRNPAIIAGLARIRAQEANTRAIGRELLPNVIASATVSGRAGGTAPSSGPVPYGDGWLPDVVNWDAGLVLQWTLLDGTVLARRQASRAREEQAKADLATIANSVVLAAQRSYLDLDAAQQAIPGLVEAVTAAQANLAQADARFRAGLGNVIEVADAEALLTNAQVDLAIGHFAADRARAALGRAVGEAARAPR
jgi:outer membrane protein TolC